MVNISEKANNKVVYFRVNFYKSKNSTLLFAFWEMSTLFTGETHFLPKFWRSLAIDASVNCCYL